MRLQYTAENTIGTLHYVTSDWHNITASGADQVYEMNEMWS